MDNNFIKYQITDNGDNSFQIAFEGTIKIIEKLLVQTIYDVNETVVIGLRSGERFHIWRWQNEENLGATSAQDLADKINTIVNNTSGGGSFTCTDVGSCIDNADSGTPDGSSLFPFYMGGLKKVSFANFFSGLVSGLNSIFLRQDSTAYVRTANEKHGNTNPGFDGVKSLITITHNLGQIPSYINICYQNTYDPAIILYNIDNITTTAFTINYEDIPGSTANLIYWEVKV